MSPQSNRRAAPSVRVASYNTCNPSRLAYSREAPGLETKAAEPYTAPRNPASRGCLSLSMSFNAHLHQAPR